ncbi:UNVERIFIED_CONTAM: hypothetical protein Sradi_7191700 [Sesamum radiatum]|uniref:Uncharacterized protein n=1 Tax=Sesamum radiatum TaxID=300843 RepID=A0AAW2IRF2_SESRA
MRSDLQDPFQKKFLQVKLSLLRKIQHFSLQLSAGELSTCRARAVRAGELAPSELVGWQPCLLAGCWSSRPASWVPQSIQWTSFS